MLFFSLSNCIYLLVDWGERHACVPGCMHGGQRTICWNRFSPSTIWGLSDQTLAIRLDRAPLPTESSHRSCFFRKEKQQQQPGNSLWWVNDPMLKFEEERPVVPTTNNVMAWLKARSKSWSPPCSKDGRFCLQIEDWGELAWLLWRSLACSQYHSYIHLGEG